MKRTLLIGLGAMLAACAAPCAAQEFGRLFLTAEQREALDARRKARVPDKPAAAAVAASPTTRLDGYVKRSGGPSTIWLNGESMTEGGQAESPRIQNRESSVSVVIGETGMRKGLKPGEIVDRGSGEVRDLIGDGEIKVRRRAK
jgi:hypothetical protein